MLLYHNFICEPSHHIAVPRSHLGSVRTPRRCGEFLGVMADKQLETHKGPEKDNRLMPGAPI